MTIKAKVIIGATGLLIVAAFAYAISEDAKRKRYNNTIVPPEYALKLIKEIKGQ